MFDIHGGGLDLIFPHHENEAAQSHGVGDGFARYWMHSHWVTMSGEKMSKSLGNILSVPAITEHTRPIALRYYLISVHYRSSIEYSREALDDASKAFERIEAFLHRVADRSADGAVPIGRSPGRLPAGDGRRPGGAAGAWRWCTSGCAPGTPRWPTGTMSRPPNIASSVRAMVAVLGLDPWAAPWADTGADRRLVEATGALIDALLVERTTGACGTGFRQGRCHPGAAGRGRICHRGHQGRPSGRWPVGRVVQEHSVLTGDRPDVHQAN